MAQPITITSIASISPLGINKEDIWASYQHENHLFKKVTFGDRPAWVGSLSESGRLEIEMLRNSNSKYQKLDDSVLYGIFSARRAVAYAGWGENENFGVNRINETIAILIIKFLLKIPLSERGKRFSSLCKGRLVRRSYGGLGGILNKAI